MSKVISVGTCDAPYKLSQREIKSFIYNLFADSDVGIENMMSVFDNSKISERHISIPIEWLGKNHTFPERNQLYVENAVNMSEKAINSCLNKIKCDYSDIDHIIFISSTGLSTPSVDAFLFNRLKLSNHIKRSPIWGLGCAGGAVGLSRAYEYTRAFPQENVLLVAVELCSLTFQKDDLSK
ncbi:MAG: type III polyketide synthase, partial [Ignavibacteria bacterium]